VGLLGRMGTGKSTLLKICAGIVAPDSGWVEIDGHRYTRPRHSVLAARGLFYLGELDNLVRTMTVRAHFDAIRRRFGDWGTDEQIDHLNVEPILDPLHGDPRFEAMTIGYRHLKGVGRVRPYRLRAAAEART